MKQMSSIVLAGAEAVHQVLGSLTLVVTRLIMEVMTSPQFHLLEYVL